jgi:hypothetical protein
MAECLVDALIAMPLSGTIASALDGRGGHVVPVSHSIASSYARSTSKKETHMARTAAEMSRQEWQAYDPWARARSVTAEEKAQAAQQRQQAWRVARQAAQCLVKTIANSQFGGWFISRETLRSPGWARPTPAPACLASSLPLPAGTPPPPASVCPVRQRTTSSLALG